MLIFRNRGGKVRRRKKHRVSRGFCDFKSCLEKSRGAFAAVDTFVLNHSIAFWTSPNGVDLIASGSLLHFYSAERKQTFLNTTPFRLVPRM
jgi:hypothetical protein